MGRVTARRVVLRVDLEQSRSLRRPDTLTVEEPLEVRVGGRAVSVTMRTPGDDLDLAAGFLVSEGVIARSDQVRTIKRCTQDGEDNTVDVSLAAGVPLPDPSLERSVYTTSSCGVCGKASLAAVRTTSPYDVATDPLRIKGELLAGLPAAMRAAQRVFDRTGGLHAVAVFDAEGSLLCLREDVGRHNAFDKVVGWALREGRLPLRSHVVVVSGRASFELVQKAWMAGLPMLAAVSAPSTLAVDLAAESGMTLIGFLRGATMNIYAGAERIEL